MSIDYQKITIWISGPQGSGKTRVSDVIFAALLIADIDVNAIRSTNVDLSAPHESYLWPDARPVGPV